jgi:hypothetical protein
MHSTAIDNDIWKLAWMTCCLSRLTERKHSSSQYYPLVFIFCVENYKNFWTKHSDDETNHQIHDSSEVRSFPLVQSFTSCLLHFLFLSPWVFLCVPSWALICMLLALHLLSIVLSSLRFWFRTPSRCCYAPLISKYALIFATSPLSTCF